MSTTMTRRSRTTALPGLVIALELPSAMLMNCSAVIRLAGFQTSWTRGRPSARRSPGELRRPLAAGPASGLSRGGRPATCPGRRCSRRPGRPGSPTPACGCRSCEHRRAGVAQLSALSTWRLAQRAKTERTARTAPMGAARARRSGGLGAGGAARRSRRWASLGRSSRSWRADPTSQRSRGARNGARLPLGRGVHQGPPCVPTSVRRTFSRGTPCSGLQLDHGRPRRARRGQLHRARGHRPGAGRPTTTSRSSRSAGPRRRCWRPSSRARPTSWSPTSGCRRPTPTRASAWPPLRDTHPEIGVVVLSHYADPAYVLALLESGSEGRAYLLKERVHDRAQLVSAIHAVAAGRLGHRPEDRRAAVLSRGARERSPLADLTPRELEVLAQIAAGQEQRGDRRDAGPHQARRREAHQLDLPEAQPRGRGGRQQARQGDAAVPGGGRRDARRRRRCAPALGGCRRRSRPGR